MSKYITLIIIFFIINNLFSQEKTYMIGELGPADGYIFYDKGFYSDGWRYLEVSSEDLKHLYPWSSFLIEIKNTSNDIGSGFFNTKAIVAVHNKKQKATLLSGIVEYKEQSAAMACNKSKNNKKDDWFLPSKDELFLIYTNIHKKGLGNFSNDFYWSSSEIFEFYAWTHNFNISFEGNPIMFKDYTFRVRCIRSF